MSPTNQPTNTTGLNVIALISGGKDSLYSLLHCLRNGHRIVALANLHPDTSPTSAQISRGTEYRGEKGKEEGEGEEEGQDDIDSFMYQTIGWGVIPLYEEALGIPLYRAPIRGGAVDTGRVYGEGIGLDNGNGNGNGSANEDEGEDEGGEDETESLIPLLKRVMRAHPEANAICAGAILSTYQRTRIEDVAGRLGLVPLAWLWMYPFLPRGVETAEVETGLLEDMAACGCEARIIKVASGALDEGFLWGDVAAVNGGLRRRIVKGMRRFAGGGFGGEGGEDIRGAVLGEGGEYETLAVDGPGLLWKRRIEVEGREVCTAQGGVAYMRLTGARCVDRVGGEGSLESVRRPILLDEAFAGALEGLREENEQEKEEEEEEEEEVEIEGRSYERRSWTPTEPVESESAGVWTVSNITAPEAGPGAAEQMAAIATKIHALLKASVRDRTTADIVFTTVLLRSMADFPLMNSIYVSLFKKPNPPARATVACGDTLPDGVNVMVSMVVDLGLRNSRHGLHVQSRSYWAPANIGPYSQAISIPLEGPESAVYIAGQIPLEPASMDLVQSTRPGESSWAETYSLRAVLSLQHMWRIGIAMEVGWWLGVVAFFTGTDHIHTRARLAWKLWERMHDRKRQEPEEEEEDEDQDAPGLDVWDIKYGGRADEQRRTVAAPRLPNFDLVQCEAGDSQVPAFLAVQVAELPRNSDIEWQGLGYRCEGVKVARERTELGHSICATTNENLRYSCIEIQKGPPGFNLKAQIQRALESFSEQRGVSHCVIYTTQPLGHDGGSLGQVVPCKSVWGTEGRELAAGLIFQNKI